MKKVNEFNLKPYIDFEYNEVRKKNTCKNILFPFQKMLACKNLNSPCFPAYFLNKLRFSNK